MAYVVKSSERLRPSGADTETKALLYLMNFRQDSNDIYYFVVDFFNDLTGMSRMSTKLWDLQSKGDKKPSPHAIGKELVTLFKNYVSDFQFDKYILFLGGVTGSLRKNSDIFAFDISNVNEQAIEEIKKGLIEECQSKTYIDNKDITDTNIDNFLNEIFFVIDHHTKGEYVKKIVKLNPAIIPDETELVAIFNEIRDKQSAKKNSGVVEGLTIEAPDDVLAYGRHLTSMEIKMLVLNRIVNKNVMDSALPVSFLNIYNRCPEETRKNLLEDCRLDLSRALFDVNGQEIFWRLFENIYTTIIENPQESVDSIYRKLDKVIISKCINFDTLSLKYFISIIKDGMDYDS